MAKCLVPKCQAVADHFAPPWWWLPPKGADAMRKDHRGFCWLHHDRATLARRRKASRLPRPFAGSEYDKRTRAIEFLRQAGAEQCRGGMHLPESPAYLRRVMDHHRLTCCGGGTCGTFTMGADPELVLTRRGRLHTAPPDFVDGDGVTGEIRPVPASTVAGLIEHVREQLFTLACRLPTDVRGSAGAYTADRPTGGHIHLHHPGVDRQVIARAVARVCQRWVLDSETAVQHRSMRGYGLNAEIRDVEWHCETCACERGCTEFRQPGSWLHSPQLATAFLSDVVREAFPPEIAARFMPAAAGPVPTRRPAKSCVFRHWGIYVIGRAESGTTTLAYDLCREWRGPGPMERLLLRSTMRDTIEVSERLVGMPFPVRPEAQDVRSPVLYLPGEMRRSLASSADARTQFRTTVLLPAAHVLAEARRRRRHPPAHTLA